MNRLIDEYIDRCTTIIDGDEYFDKRTFADMLMFKVQDCITEMYHKMPLEYAVFLLDLEELIMDRIYAINPTENSDSD